MALVELQYPPGLSRGATPSERPGRWYDNNLVRFVSGVARPWGGWQRMNATATLSPPRRLLAWRDLSDAQRVALGCDDHLQIVVGGQTRDITPNDFRGVASIALPDGFGVGDYGEETYGTPRSAGSIAFLRAPTWSLYPWGEDLLALSSTDRRLLRWSRTFTSPKAAVVSAAPINSRAMVVTPQRHVMLIGYGGNSRDIAWCSQDDYNDWNFASETNTARFLPIQTPGLLQAAVVAGDDVLILADTEAYLAFYQGPPFVYGVRRVGANVSILGANSLVAYAGGAVWLGRSGFYRFNLGGAVEPLRCDVLSFVLDNVHPTLGVLRTHGQVNGRFPEITWSFPSKASKGECDLSVTWNWEEDTWVVHHFGRACWFPAGVLNNPLACDAAGILYAHESGTTANGTAFAAGEIYLQSATNAIGSGDRVMDVLEGQLDSGSNYSACRVVLSGKQYRDASDARSFIATPLASGRMDIRFGARDIQLRIENQAGRNDWSVGRMRFDVSEGGGR